MAKLFHATNSNLDCGKRIRVRPSAIPADRQSVEDFLDDHRPQEVSSRKTSWFACAEPGHAARFLAAEIAYKCMKNGESRLYSVEMPLATKHPMVLVDAINRELLAGREETAAALADEYWNPTQAWRFWEYIGPEITVLQQLQWPDTIEHTIAFQTYSVDTKLRDDLLPGLRKVHDDR